MLGDISLRQKYQDYRCICKMHKTSSYTSSLWRTSNFRGIQKHAPYKIVFGIISHKESMTSGRNSEKNINKRKDR